MKAVILFGMLLAVTSTVQAQSGNNREQKKKYEATPPAPIYFGGEAFGNSDKTVIRWMDNGGFSVNSRGTTLMVCR